MAGELREALIKPRAISHNVETLRLATPTPHTMVVVKADGYGHGAVTAAHAALEGGADWLGTADIPEALELRGAGITQPILAWIYGSGSELSGAYENGIDLGVSGVWQLELIRSVVSHKPARIHLKIDSGLARNGAWSSEWDELFRTTKKLEAAGVIELVGMFTHLSGASREADSAQGEVFDTAVALAESHGLVPEIRHVSASLGSSQTPSLARDMVRYGVAAYGIGQTPAQAGLQAAMRLSGQIISLKRVPAGTGVGYGHTYQTSQETTLALVPLGYADGVPRHASNAGPVLISGKRFTVSGRVSMDQIIVDIGDTSASIGDRAVLWGDGANGEPTADEWAMAADTIAYEIITRVGPRVTRVVQA
jgi:alanine racemase